MVLGFLMNGTFETMFAKRLSSDDSSCKKEVYKLFYMLRKHVEKLVLSVWNMDRVYRLVNISSLYEYLSKEVHFSATLTQLACCGCTCSACGEASIECLDHGSCISTCKYLKSIWVSEQRSSLWCDNYTACLLWLYLLSMRRSWYWVSRLWIVSNNL